MVENYITSLRLRGRLKLLFSSLLLTLLLFSPLSASAQELTVVGNVKDKDGEPLIGVSVVIVGTQTGTFTTTGGYYTLKVAKNATLEFTLLGFEKLGVKVDKTQIDVTMHPNPLMMDDIIVVGYGQQKKVNITGSVVQIKGESLLERNSANLVAALQGELAGVVVTQSSGQPGDEGLAMQVRGHTSTNAIEPLILIDGIEGALDMVNPHDVESISVLKDASSSSIYGSRAAGGVVLVTTKKGGDGRVEVRYDGAVSIKMQGRMPARLNSWEEYEIVQRANKRTLNYQDIEFLKNPNLNSTLRSSTMLNYFDNTNWLKEGLKKFSSNQRHNISILGGAKSLNYRVSLGYFGDEGFLRHGPDGVDRFNARVDLNSKIGKYLTFSTQLSASTQEVSSSAYSSKAVMNLLYRGRTRMSVYYPQEDDPIPNPNIYAGQEGSNPIDVMKNSGKATNMRENFVLQASLEAKDFVDGLSIKLSAFRNYRFLSWDKLSQRLIWYSRGLNEFRYSQTRSSFIEKQRDKDVRDKFNAIVNYDFRAGYNHNFHILAGYEGEVFSLNRVWASKNDMPDGLGSFNFGSAETALNRDLIVESATNSLFARLNYNFREKYLLEANARYDESSRLAPGNRSRIFPSVALAWVVSKEPFFRNNVNFINMLKIRTSWGQLGNAEALSGYYDYERHLSSDRTILGEQLSTTHYVNILESIDETWEVIETANIGLDISAFNGRFTFSGDIYQKRNKNMLATMEGIPSLIGVGLPYFNVGELKTEGWEVELMWRDRIGKVVNYWVGFNLADSRNKLVKYDGVNIIKEGIVKLLEGHSLNTVWGYKTAGLYQDTPSWLESLYQPGGSLTNKGDLRYVNLDRDPHINGGAFTPENSGDLINFGSTDPRYTYGIKFGASWKGLSLSVFLQGVGKRNFLYNSDTLNPTSGSLYQAMDFHRDYWTENNTGAFFPRPVYQGGSYNYKPADRWIQNGAYLRLKNITLSYELPWRPKWMSRLSVYVSGDNLAEFTKTWKQFDPEAPEITGANSWYAYSRSVTFGINLTFK